MRKSLVLPILLLCLAAAPAAHAQKPALQPGALPLEDLAIFPEDKVSIEINLDGALLRMVAESTKGADPGLSSLLANLKAIRVRVLPLEGENETSIKSNIGRVVRWLEGQGWKSTVRVRDKGEETYIYMKEMDGKIAGMTVLAMEPGVEAVVINIVGRFDPAEIGRIGRGLDLPGMDRVPESKPQDGKKKPE